MVEQKGLLFSMVSLVLISFLGNGFFWEYNKLRNDAERLSMEKGKSDLEKEKINLDKLRFIQEKETSQFALQKQRVEQNLERDKYRMEVERFDMERTRSTLEQEKYSMEKTKDIMALRQKKNDVLAEVVKLSEEYIKQAQARIALERKGADKQDEIALINSRVEMLRVRLESQKAEFKDIEHSLAKIENRELKMINLEFLPLEAPRSFRIMAN